VLFDNTAADNFSSTIVKIYFWLGNGQFYEQLKTVLIISTHFCFPYPLLAHLTLSLPIPLRLYTLSQWSERQSARMPNIKNSALDPYGA